MTDMILIYVPCNSLEEARMIGEQVMKMKIAPCYNIIPQIESAAFWPPNTREIEKVNASVLILKTIEEKFEIAEKEISKLHSDKNPCIFSIHVNQVSQKYYDWLKSEIV